MLKRKSAAARPPLKPRKTARKRVTKGQVRTDIVIDRELVEKAKAKAQVRTTREAVNAALAEFVKPYDYSGLLALRGTGCIAEDYDPGAGAAAKFLGWERVYPTVSASDRPLARNRSERRIVIADTNELKRSLPLKS